MSYTFEEIMAYHPDNRDVYREIKDALPRLVPFVGAGLTQFAYFSWPNALRKLSDKLTDSKNIQKVHELIDSGHYLNAAQFLEDLRTPTNLARDIANLFSSDKLEQKRNQLPREPIFLLPLLFPELVLTTNYDETLETVYRESGHPFQSILLPGHPELLRQFIRQGGTCSLLKLHGTLSGGCIEYGKIVFTLEQYNRHYGKHSPLTCDLKTCFEDRMILFLGCSLESDRTMELLQTVLQPGRNYYAITNCEQSERDAKIRHLGEKHIRVILYENDRHEAVRVILEHLLEEYDSSAYDRLPVHVGALTSAYTPERFSYKAEIIPFSGREHELQSLTAFLSDAGTAFRWWAVTGPGGIGKSRLAYEFQKQLPPDWSSYYLSPGDYANLHLLAERFPQKTLVIADYVQENAKAIGKWMEQLYEKKRNLPIRVLLVERESSDNPEAPAWTKQLYTDVFHEESLKYSCYQKHFLTLQPLADKDLLEIIENYSAFLLQNHFRSDNTLPISKEILLQKLKSIDPQLCRPLYAMFLTDTYMDGENPEHWNSNDILNHLIKRDQKRLKMNMRQILGYSDENLYAACVYLQVIATAFSDVSIEQLQQSCPETWRIIASKADYFVSPINMLEQFGLAINDKIPALHPDLIGEYLVCQWLLEHPDQIQRFLCAVWQKPASSSIFFCRMIKDYRDLINSSPKYWKLILPEDLPLMKSNISLYAAVIEVAVVHCSIVNECKRQVNLLERLTIGCSDSPSKAAMFASGLYILFKKQDEPDSLQTLARLELLSAKYNDSLITRLYAMSLLILSTKQTETNAIQTLARLKCLALKHREILLISVILAKALFYLSCRQSKLDDLQQTVTHLEHLAAAYPDVPEITVCFAKSLVNLCYFQDKLQARQTAIRLKYLVSQHPQIPEMADALSRLSGKS